MKRKVEDIEIASASDQEAFIYTGQSRHDIPRDVTHVKVDPSIKVIGRHAFYDFKMLRWVELCKGLEHIDGGAFKACKSLERIIIPSNIKVIGERAFSSCTMLRGIELHEGLERIDRSAFYKCTSLECIVVPSTVKVIGAQAFYSCWMLRGIELRAVEYIATDAFENCSRSVGIIEFSSGMEQFLSEVSLP